MTCSGSKLAVPHSYQGFIELCLGQNVEEEKEDLIHVLLWCPGYREERRKSVKLQQPYIQEEEDIVGRSLFNNKDIEEAKREITSFWKIRERIRKEREREKEKSDKGQTQTQTTEHIRECR